MRVLVLVVLFVANFLVAPKSRSLSPVRIVLYNGPGTSSGSVSGYAKAFEALNASGIAISYTLAKNDTIQEITLQNTDVILFPGGSGNSQAKALGPIGIAAVHAFISSGGGYIGTCGGGFLAVPGRCCDQKMKGYCDGEIGCFNASKYKLDVLDIINAAATEPWDRGDGNVTVRFSALGVKTLGLPEDWTDMDTKILYAQGPIMRHWKYTDMPSYKSMATYTSEIHSKHSEWTTGEMKGTDAIVVSTFGKGRVLVSSPHPEATKPPILKLIEAYVMYVAGRV